MKLKKKIPLIDKHDRHGFWGGKFGGSFIPETLKKPVEDLTREFSDLRNNKKFLKKRDYYFKNYVGSPTPLIPLNQIPDHLGGAQIWAKVVSENPGTAHKIYNAIVHCLIAKRAGKKFVCGDTGAGMAGKTLAMVAKKFGLKCKIFMGVKDIKRQKPNVDAMNKFAEAETSKINALNAQNTIAVNEANAKREASLNQYNATLENQRQQFNVNNQKEIDQSNVVWRRAINTANTAAVNAANQANAQNILNLSNWALSSLWQQWRDEASWVNTSSENTQNRNHNLAMAALESWCLAMIGRVFGSLLGYTIVLVCLFKKKRSQEYSY